MEINNTKGPAVVISASGMADAGRIKHHLRHNLWREGASIVFVGFQAQGTTGRKIVDGAQKVRIFNEEIVVKAKIFTINGFSAHAGQSQLLEWLGHFKTQGLQIFLIHGEYSAQKELASLIKSRFGIEVAIPDYLEEVTLEVGRELERVAHPEQATPRIDWGFLISDMETRLAQLRERRGRMEAKAWVEQTEAPGSSPRGEPGYRRDRLRDMMTMETDEKWMRLALEEAFLAGESDEVPVGAVIVRGEELLARAHNSPITLNDPSAHAEVLAIRQAASLLGNYRLAGTTLYVTLEPCLMCAGAILQARIGRIVFGAADPKGGAVVSLYRLFDDRRLNHTVAVTEGVLRGACTEILSGFFRAKRLISPP